MTNEKQDFKDYRTKEYKLLEDKLENEMIKVMGIPRAIHVEDIETFKEGLNSVQGFLELGPENFIKFYAEFPKDSKYSRNPLNYMAASNESNQRLEVLGLYNYFSNEIQIKSIQLGNLEKAYFSNKMILSGCSPPKGLH